MKSILRTDMPRDMYLVKQVGANGSNSVLPGLGTSSQSSLRLQGQQALQHQPAVLYLVGNVSIGMLPKGFGPAATSHCRNHTKHNRDLQEQLQSWSSMLGKELEQQCLVHSTQQFGRAVGSFFASTEQPSRSSAVMLAIRKVRVGARIDSMAYLEALKGGGFRNAVQGERGQWVGVEDTAIQLISDTSTIIGFSYEILEGSPGRVHIAIQDGNGEERGGAAGEPEAEVWVRLLGFQPLHNLVQGRQPAGHQVAVGQEHPVPSHHAILDQLSGYGGLHNALQSHYSALQ
ncbi:MAG: hypothetical protein FRX49_08636 [Trebouxia sp. A1-2]|nr:MAG: hypothetical protein FRX49_08636 [Trebouxia sp. A1-2]